MIDREARDNLAERLRKLANATITNDEFEDRGRGSKVDQAIRETEFLLAWPRYDDLHEHRLDGDHKLTDGTRKDFARAVLFLKSNYEYRWPRRTGWNLFKQLLSLGRLKGPKMNGDLRYWPFYSRSEYQAALRRHPYLRGSKNVAEQSSEL